MSSVCGIAGIISPRRDLVDRALPAMVAAQRHRGPDDQGRQVMAAGDLWVGLGQRRLSIIDLSPLGHQPMVHPETGDVLIYNGELYNFAALRKQLAAAGSVFRGTSDTEVLLHALVRWGSNALDRLEGMYAFGFFVPREGRLLLGRDPLGIKPLYVGHSGSSFLFASEVRAMLASGAFDARIDPLGMAGYLAYAAVQEPFSIVKGIESFPAGSFQWLDLGGPAVQGRQVTRYWQFPAPLHSHPDAASDSSTDESNAVGQLETLLNESVRDHLVSDVPVAVFLSSGLDSTVIAGLGASHMPDLRTFTVGFADQPDMSETGLAEQTGQLFGVQHSNISVTAENCQSLALDWLRCLDQPSVDGLNVFIISKLVREQGITVALSGLGGDELFGGYPSFRDVPRLRRAVRRLSWLPASLRSAAARLALLGRPYAVRQKLSDMMATEGDILSLYLHRRRALSDRQLLDLGVDAGGLGLNAHLLDPAVVADLPGDPSDATWLLSVLESRFYMGNMLLRDNDTNGMAHSLEIRVPFLGRPLIDFAYRLPGPIRLPEALANKHLIRRAFGALLRPALADQRKRGFTLPIKRWMIGPLRDLCEHSIQQLSRSGPLRPKGVKAVWSAFCREPETPIWTRAWSLCILGIYLENLKKVAASA